MIEVLLRVPLKKTIIKKVKVWAYDDAVFNHQKTWRHVPTKHLDTFYPFNIITEEICND